MGQSYTLNTYQYVGGPLATAKIYDESNTLQRTVTYAYGPEGETASVTGSTEPVAYTYDAAYRLASLSDGNSHSAAYSYNTAGYLSQVTYPGSDTVSYTSYDDAGNLLQRVDGRSITTNYVYADGDGLLSAIQYPASTSLNVSLSYDGYDRLTSMSDGTGSHSYSYDDLDALTSETTTYTGIAGKTLNYGYYNDGSRSSMTGAAGSFSYYYDGAGRMTSVVNPYSETSAWTYLNNNWLKTQQLANNATTTYTYDALARVTDLVTRAGPNPTDTLLSSFTGMVYDGAGNRTYMSASIPAHTAYSGNTSYTYDSKDQLTQESSTRAGGYTNNFSYDSAGNSTSFKGTSHSYNSNNQDTGNSYDGNGNPTTYSGTTCTFDPENRMTAFGSALTATYRGDGLRAKTVTSAGTAYFLYDGEVLLAEMNSSGSITAVSTWGIAGLLSRTNSSGSRFYSFDPQGSVAQRLDGSGAVLTSDVFDGYGTGASTGSVDACGYNAQSGYYTDLPTSLQYLANRYYDPSRGAFVTRDPVRYAGGANLYSYVGNSPIVDIDPFGLTPTIGNRLPAGDDGIVYRPNKRGGAPLDKDGNPIELHHVNQEPDGVVDEMTREAHRGKGNHGRNHPNRESDVDHGKEWDKFRKEHWRNEWDKGRFKDLPAWSKCAELNRLRRIDQPGMQEDFTPYIFFIPAPKLAPFTFPKLDPRPLLKWIFAP